MPCQFAIYADNAKFLMNRLNRILFLITLGGLSAFGPFVTDMYLPSLPSLPQAFSTTPFWVQMSMSVCMIGLAAGQVVIGPLSDKFGRRIPLLISMWMFVLASLACIFATNIYFFIAMRFFQGVAGAGGIVLSRSIPSDMYSGMELARFLALVAAVHSIAPVAAPIAGGITILYADWRFIFAILFFLGLILMVLSYRMGETLGAERRSRLSTLAIFKLYKNVLLDKVALFYILQQGSMSIILFVYISTSPYIFQNIYGLNAISFSGIFALNAAGIGVGAMLSSKFHRRRTAVVFSGVGVFVAAIMEACLIYRGAGVVGVESVIFVMMFMFGVAAPAAAAIVLDSQRRNAGTAAALLGALQFLMGSLAVSCTGIGRVTTAFAAMIIIGGFLGALLSLVARHYQKKFGPSTI